MSTPTHLDFLGTVLQAAAPALLTPRGVKGHVVKSTGYTLKCLTHMNPVKVLRPAESMHE